MIAALGNALEHAGVASGVPVAAGFLPLKDANCVLQLLRRFRLFFPEAVICIVGPRYQFRRNVMRPATNEAFIVYDVKVARC